MPVRNRDEETLYPKGRLNRWFAVSAVALVVVLGMMIWKDYARPWKDYQRSFREMQGKVADLRAEELGKAIDPQRVDNADKALKARREKIDANRLRAIEERLHALDAEERAADIAVKEAQARLTEARYEYDQARAARLEGHAGAAGRLERRTADANRFGTALDVAKTRLSNVQGERSDLEKERAAILAPLKPLEEELAAARKEQDDVRMRQEGIRQRYLSNRWRDAPIIDFIAPSLKIDQVVVKDVHDNYNFATNHKVDRCTTCHLGVDQPDFGDPKIVEPLKIPGWMRAHPALDLIAKSGSPHAKERFGCSVCHAGVGWSTDFARAAHTPTSAEERERWEREHDWSEAPFIDFPMLPPEYVEGQCHKCHKEGLYFPPAYLERLDHGYVLPRIAQEGPFKGQFVGQKGPDGRPLGPLEVFGDYRLPAAPAPVDGSAEEIAQATRAELSGENLESEARAAARKKVYEQLDADYQVRTFGWRAERFQKGYDSMVAYGCQGCHKIQDFGQQVGYEIPPRVAPDLRYVGDKVTSRWLERWIRAPETYRIDTPMPSFLYFVPKDADWNPKRDANGRLVTMPVMDAHLLDPALAERLEGQRNAGPNDLAQIDVEILAMKTYLLAVSRTRTDKARPDYDADYEEPPPGDRENGRRIVNAYGCAACHVLPEVEVDGRWVKDDGARFGGEMLLPGGALRGPRLTSLGSKLKDRRWINAWLASPRHYTAWTRMPDMRWRDQKDATGKVERTAAEVRADVVDYLLSFRDPEFESIPDTTLATETHFGILRDMYEEFFGRAEGGRLVRQRDLEGRLGDLENPERLMTVLRDVGEKLMTHRGCFGCHEQWGHEKDLPIGTELTREGVKDLHMLDFGRLSHGTSHDVVPHDRWSFFRTKITYPRIWEVGKFVRWTDRLRMPRFNFRMDDPAPAIESAPATAGNGGDGKAGADEEPAPKTISTRGAITGILLGLVDEPIKPGAFYQPDAFAKDVIDGRRVAKRYGCNNCHTLEGKQGLLAGWLLSDEKGSSKLERAFAPPNLFGEGARVQQGWLRAFLERPFDLRPQVVPRMPRFGLSPEESVALARYFARLSGDRLNLSYQPESRIPTTPFAEPLTVTSGDRTLTLRDPVQEAEALFNTINCNKCHLPKGTPGADPAEGGVAPSFELAAKRLQRDWVRTLINDPAHLIYATKMTQFWTAKRGYGRTVADAYQPFLLDLRDDPEFQALQASSESAKKDEATKRLAERQMDWIADYVVHHYRPPPPPAEAPR